MHVCAFVCRAGVLGIAYETIKRMLSDSILIEGNKFRVN